MRLWVATTTAAPVVVGWLAGEEAGTSRQVVQAFLPARFSWRQTADQTPPPQQISVGLAADSVGGANGCPGCTAAPTMPSLPKTRI